MDWRNRWTGSEREVTVNFELVTIGWEIDRYPVTDNLRVAYVVTVSLKIVAIG